MPIQVALRRARAVLRATRPVADDDAVCLIVTRGCAAGRTADQVARRAASVETSDQDREQSHRRPRFIRVVHVERRGQPPEAREEAVPFQDADHFPSRRRRSR